MAKMGKYLPAGGDHFDAAIDKVLISNDLRRAPHRNGCSELAKDVQND